MRKLRKGIISFIISITVCLVTVAAAAPVQEASAASKYIKVEEFAETLANEVGLSPIPGKEASGDVNILLSKGIIKEEDFTSYESYLTRTDAAVLLNRADEYLYGDTLDTELVNFALDKRISDIKNIKASKRTDVVKCYLKGFIKGYSNGAYSTDREFRGNKKITRNGVLKCLDKLKDKSSRAEISPDGQLIRTTKLPKYAEYYPYILSSYPNDYYDWEFRYEGVESYDENGDLYELQNLIDYATPIDVDKTTYYDDFAETKEKYLNQWVDKVRTYMEYVFSVDYRTINEEWLEGVLPTHFYYDVMFYEDEAREDLEKYIADVKKYHTVIEYDTIAVDGSSLYYYSNEYYLRTYVKYQIVNTDIASEMDTNTLARYKWHNKLLYSEFYVDIRGFEIGEWREGYYDISLCDMKSDDGIYLGVSDAIFMDGYYKYGQVN